MDQQLETELQELLDKNGAWLVRSLDGQAVPTGTLREALTRAYVFAQQGHSLGPIIKMPEDRIVVQPDQLYCLWQKFGLVNPDHPA